MRLTNLTAPSFKTKQNDTTEKEFNAKTRGRKDAKKLQMTNFQFLIFNFPQLFAPWLLRAFALNSATVTAGLRLSAVLLFGLATSVQAQFTYTTNNGAITITGYTGSGGAVTIPDMIDGLLVTDIGTNAFENSRINNVTIPDPVTNIEDAAFVGCVSLTNVNLGNGVKTIGARTFAAVLEELGDLYGPVFCPLTSVTIPDSVTIIGDYAFWGCEVLTNVDIGDNVTSIGAYAFSGYTGTESMAEPGPCPLTSVTIPDSVANIGAGAFEGCVTLTNVKLSLGLTDIETNAFAGSGLTSITIPDIVTNIGDYAFQGCPLTNVTIPNSVTNIGDAAFAYCGNLTAVYFLGSAPATGGGVFSYDSHNVAAYYLPGTSGWAQFATNIPTAFWTLPNPVVLSQSVSVQGNQFGFTISWATNIPVVVEASTDLSKSAWAPIATNTLSGGTSYFSDPKWTNYPARFYRLSL
jgi:hypothetical protein